MALGEETWRREASWEATFNELKLYHDKAYKKIDEALKFDEEGQKNKALAAYDEGLMLIDKALAVNIECPSNPDFSWEKACSMVDKLRKTRLLSCDVTSRHYSTTNCPSYLARSPPPDTVIKEILSRIADTQVQRPAELRPPERPEDLALEPPPSYEEAMATSPVNRSPAPVSSPRTYTELGQALQELKVEADMQSVQVIFHVEDVRVYFISPDGTVSAPSQPNQLRILQLEVDCTRPGRGHTDSWAPGCLLRSYLVKVIVWLAVTAPATVITPNYILNATNHFTKLWYITTLT
ncbi:Spartin [Homalodisca vitripennis]|nr:Spartin [Homalodisca vitripennis]